MEKNLPSTNVLITPSIQQLTLQICLPAGNADSTKTSVVCCVHTSPKKRPLSTVTNDELRMIQKQLNNRPRKRLEFKTTNGVFMQSLKRVALYV
jgi:hypothetical protein